MVVISHVEPGAGSGTDKMPVTCRTRLTCGRYDGQVYLQLDIETSWPINLASNFVFKCVNRKWKREGGGIDHAVSRSTGGGMTSLPEVG